MRRRGIAVSLLTSLAVGAVLLVLPCTTDRNYTSNVAASKAHKLVHACLLYRQRPGSDGRYPNTLADLLRPPSGGPPLVDDPTDLLTDPWGNSFRYALVRTQSGEPEPHVWAEWVRDGHTRLPLTRLDITRSLNRATGGVSHRDEAAGRTLPHG